LRRRAARNLRSDGKPRLNSEHSAQLSQENRPHAHSGTKAVHFHSTTVNNGQRAYILTQGAPAFPVTADAVYVRFMMYIGRRDAEG
jgi:hypothetical protein